MRFEADLLLRCAQSLTRAEEQVCFNTAVNEDVDWSWLFASAGTHGVSSMLYSYLDARWPTELNRIPLETLREEIFRTARRSLLMSRELLAILDLFAANDLEARPFKGPVLAAAEYGNIALRPFCDLDILVRKDDVSRAKSLLVSRGYVPEYQMTPEHESAWRRGRNDINLRRPDLDIVAELHWDVVPRRLCVPFDNDRLWTQTDGVSIGGREIRTLSPENLILVLSAHGAKHGWTRLIWICDIAAVITNHPEIDWTDVMREARRLGIERMVGLALRLARDLAACDLPQQVRGLAEDRRTAALAQEVAGRLFEPASGGYNVLERTLFHATIRERFRDKIRYGLYNAFVPSAGDRLLVGLPRPLALGYFLLRPVRLARKYWWPSVQSKSAAIL